MNIVESNQDKRAKTIKMTSSKQKFVWTRNKLHVPVTYLNNQTILLLDKNTQKFNTAKGLAIAAMESQLAVLKVLQLDKTEYILILPA